MSFEIAHGAPDASGYMTLVRQVRAGMEAIGEPCTVEESPSFINRAVYAPKMPVLVDASRTPGLVMPRWVDSVTGEEVKFGTQFRQWVSDRDMLWVNDSTRRLDTPGGRDVTRLVTDLPEYADWTKADRRMLFTMWESSALPQRFRPWAPYLRRAGTILVPSEHSRRLVRSVVPESTVRVRVVPLALEAEAWPYVDRAGRPEDAPFIFLMVGDLSIRKGFHLAYKAFMELFEGNPKAHLVFKTRGMSDFCQPAQWPKYVPMQDVDGAPMRDDDGELIMIYNKDRVRWKLRVNDPNVHVCRGDWSRKNLARLYAMADCFVWPSLGEGWGYPPREAAATGLPVITPSHTGMADASEWALTVGHAKGKVARYKHWGECGHWYQPDYDDLKRQMLWAFENRAAGLALGAKASEYVTRRTPADLALDILAEAELLGHRSTAKLAA